MAASPGAAKTALDRYIEAPDPSYKYAVAATIPGNGYTASVIEMTSQTWRTFAEVDRTVWKHWLTVIKPAEVRHKTAFLYITGGNNNSGLGNLFLFNGQVFAIWYGDAPSFINGQPTGAGASDVLIAAVP